MYLAFYLVFLGIHVYGAGEALKLMFVITAIACVALLVFIVAMVPHFSAERLFDIPATDAVGASSFLPFGESGDPLIAALMSPNAYGQPTLLSRFVNFVGLAGLVASFFSLTYGYSRLVFATRGIGAGGGVRSDQVAKLACAPRKRFY